MPETTTPRFFMSTRPEIHLDRSGGVNPAELIPRLDTLEGFFLGIALLGALNRALTLEAEPTEELRTRHREMIHALLYLGSKLHAAHPDNDSLAAGLDYIESSGARFLTQLSDPAAEHLLQEIFGCQTAAI